MRVRLILVLLVLGGCAQKAQRPLVERLENANVMRDSMLAIAPAGTTMDSAQVRLGLAGLRCHLDSGVIWDHRGGQYLRCTARTSSKASVYQSWNAAVFLDSTRVTDIVVKTELTGP